MAWLLTAGPDCLPGEVAEKPQTCLIGNRKEIMHRDILKNTEP